MRLPALLLLVLVDCIVARWLGRPFFLRSTYETRDKAQRFAVRQVPGDGGCLFHAISACLYFRHLGRHVAFDGKLRQLSNELRNLSVAVLESDDWLFVMDDQPVRSSALVDFVAQHYNLSRQEYCDRMRSPSAWGGGPEIVALANHFRCPIHVFGLCPAGFSNRSFRFELIARFGNPLFAAEEPICLLNVDGRFPDLPAGDVQPPDHFLALFPCPPVKESPPQESSPLRRCPHLRRHLLPLPD